MSMDRRAFLKGGVALSAMALTVAEYWPAPPSRLAVARFEPRPKGWRAFEITTDIVIPDTGDAVRAWVPLPSISTADWISPLGDRWESNTSDATVRQVGDHGARLLAVSWAGGGGDAVVTVKSRVATRDRAVNWGEPPAAVPLSAADRALFTAASDLVPTDGIVRQTAAVITRGKTTDLAKVRALYEWIVINTYRDAKTRGCGTGDIVALLRGGAPFGGKCADVNALFVGFARSLGIPARELYGIRVAPSQFGYGSLGASGDITTAQHCRAEVHLDGFGWLPMDPADVRKVMLEEAPGNLPLGNARVAAARRTLFGAWETNWIAYNDARDVQLPGSAGPALGFLMYPQAESAAGRFDCLEPDAFKYTISAREIAL